LSRASDRTQNIQFSFARVSRLRDQVAEHIGGSAHVIKNSLLPAAMLTTAE
jgi:hypothetical protein